MQANSRLNKGYRNFKYLKIIKMKTQFGDLVTGDDELTEEAVKELGYLLDCKFNHDQFNTNRYRKGLLIVEFTYEEKKLLTVDLTIDETFSKPITYSELKAITPVLGCNIPQ